MDKKVIAVCCCLRTAYVVEGTKPRYHWLAEEDKTIGGEEGPNRSSLLRTDSSANLICEIGPKNLL